MSALELEEISRQRYVSQVLTSFVQCVSVTPNELRIHGAGTRASTAS